MRVSVSIVNIRVNKRRASDSFVLKSETHSFAAVQSAHVVVVIVVAVVIVVVVVVVFLDVVFRRHRRRLLVANVEAFDYFQVTILGLKGEKWANYSIRVVASVVKSDGKSRSSAQFVWGKSVAKSVITSRSSGQLKEF